MLALSTRSQRAQWKVSSAGRDGSGFIGDPYGGESLRGCGTSWLEAFMATEDGDKKAGIESFCLQRETCYKFV